MQALDTDKTMQAFDAGKLVCILLCWHSIHYLYPAVLVIYKLNVASSCKAKAGIKRIPYGTKLFTIIKFYSLPLNHLDKKLTDF